MRKYFNLLNTALPFLFIAGVIIIIFFKIVFFGQVFYEGFDNFNNIIPLKFFLVEQIKHGIFPLWNPYIFTGVPYFADLTFGNLSIFNLLFFLTTPAKALTITTVLVVFLIALFQYVFLRTLHFSRPASTLGGITFVLAGNVFLGVNALEFLTVVVYIPLLFTITVILLRKKSFSYLLLLTLVQSLQILSGHPRETYYTILFISFFILFTNDLLWKKKLLLLGIYYVGVTLLTSMQIIPFIEYVLSSNRPLSSINFASSGSLGIINLITFFLPTFFGVHSDGSWWGPQNVLFGYMTLPGYFLLLAGLRKGKVFYGKFFIGLLILCILLAVGKYSPVYLFFYYIVPGWKTFRAPIDVMVFFTFFSTIFIANGFDHITLDKHVYKLQAQKIFSLFFLLLTPLVLLYTVFGKKVNFWRDLLVMINQHVPILHIQRLLIYDQIKLHVMFQGILLNVIVLIASLLFFYLVREFLKNQKIGGISLLILVSCLFIYFDQKTISTAPEKYILSGFPVPTILHDVQNGEFRVLTLPIVSNQQREHLAPSNFFYKESIAKLTTYTADTNMLEYVYQANGTIPLVPNSFAKFVSSKSRNNVTEASFENITQTQMSLSSIKYLISFTELKNPPSYLQLISADAGIRYIYKNSSARKRLYLLSDAQGENVQFTQVNPEKIVATVNSPIEDKLIVTNWFYPGWQATVNGKQVDVTSYLQTFQKVTISKGISHVVLTYQPKLFHIGLWVTLLSTIAFVFSMTFLGKKKI